MCKENLEDMVGAPHDSFLDGNELLEEAIDEYCQDSSKDKLVAVLNVIRNRMHEEGHFILPVLVNEEDESQFAFRSVQTNDGENWIAAFTSYAEYEKGEQSMALSHFIYSSMKLCLEAGAPGLIINPWGTPFMLDRELIELIFEADGDVEYFVPDDPITAELLEDGSFLKRALEICNRNWTQLNMIKLARILRDSWVWIPCNAILSDSDYKIMEKAVKEAEAGEGLDSLVGRDLTVQDEVRMVPDILQSGEEFFFPVFTTVEEMGEYGESFSKYQLHFLHAINLARNNERNLSGIVINPFSEPFVVKNELLDIIADRDSGMDGQDED